MRRSSKSGTYAPMADKGHDSDLPGNAWKIFDAIDANIAHADVKAGAILGACGIVSAALIGLVTSRGSRDILLLAAATASGIFILTAAAFSCGTLWPRRLRNRIPDSILYFDHIARRTSAQLQAYEDELSAILADPETLTREIIKQVWATANVAAKKYDFLDRAMICLFGSLVTLCAAAVFFGLHYHGR